MTDAIINLEHIDITFHQKKRVIEAVKDVSVSIHKGDIYGIVGYSGAGKSTLVRVINLLQVPTAGKITINGDVTYDQGKVQLSSAALRQKRQKIGMIFQHFNLMAQKTASENVAFALRHSDLSKEAKAKKVSELLELVGLSDRADNYPAQLSGGQKQRVAIARALALNPSLIVADEPTSALDVSVRAQVLNLLADLKKELNLSMVFISHDLQTVRQVSDRIVVMNGGKIVEQGDAADVFERPTEEYTRILLDAAPSLL